MDTLAVIRGGRRASGLRSGWVVGSLLVASMAVAGQESEVPEAQRWAVSDATRREAIVALDERLLEAPDRSEWLLRRGELLLYSGAFERSLADLDRMVQLDPAQEPYLWQRGIAQYYAGAYAAGRQQFEAHRRVNGDDVENSIWHFLCTAHESDLATACTQWLPIEVDSAGSFPDTRVPLREIYDLFAREAEPESVLAAARSVADPARRSIALVYADLYLGLWHEIHGRPEHARLHLERLARPSPRSGFAMHEIGVMHYRKLYLERDLR